MVIGAVTALAAVAAVVVALLAANKIDVSVPPSTTPTQTVTETVTQTTTVDDGGPSEPPAPISVGLTELHEQEDVQFQVEAQFETRTIGKKEYTDAVTGLVYPDNSGFDELTIETKGRFDLLRFVVGIDAETECPQARAQVAVQNEYGVSLWGPETVSIRPKSAVVPLHSALQATLTQTSLASDGSCFNGEAHVSWGGVVFERD